MKQKNYSILLLSFNFNMKKATYLSEKALRSLLLTFPTWLLGTLYKTGNRKDNILTQIQTIGLFLLYYDYVFLES